MLFGRYFQVAAGHDHLIHFQENEMTDLKDIPRVTIDGEQTSLGDYAGKVLLIVNVASKCGLTPQYEALQQLYERMVVAILRCWAFPPIISVVRNPGPMRKSRHFVAPLMMSHFRYFSRLAWQDRTSILSTPS